MTGLKVAAIGLMALLGALLFVTVRPAERAHAEPTAVIGLNSGLCTALGVAFAELDSLAALNDCQQMTSGNGAGSFQDFACRLEHRTDCPVAAELPPLQPDADLLKVLDLDKNQVHEGQRLIVFAFVNDDAPVRFTTDLGVWVQQQLVMGGTNTVPIGQDYFCETTSAGGLGDPDCDGTDATPGDGVVIGQILIRRGDPTGTGHINVIQEGIGFPMDFTVVGKPDTIVLSPLFGKDTISTGATPPTLGKNAAGIGFDANAQETDCDFQASVSGVLGAVAQAEKTVVIAKVLDNEGTEVVGALLDWTHPFGPTGEKGPTRQAAVALPQTPTLDLGSIGVGFPQFVCGLQDPGDFETNVTFDAVLDPITAGNRAHDSVTIKVLGPADRISLVADPAEIDCNGTNSSKVTATVTTATGEPAANGLDVNFSVLALGTANPLKTDTTGGAGSTTVTPLSGAASLGDGGPTGVTVTASARGKRTVDIFGQTTQDQFTSPLPPFAYDNYVRDENTLEKPPHIPTIVGAPTTVQQQILVRCSGVLPAPAAPAPVAPAPAGGAAGASGRPSGISGPDTGYGSGVGSAALPWWPLLALAGGAMVLGMARKLAQRSS